ncbi:NAD-dependent epimerase/dehydratase family protein [Photobacterium chitinilyticum]|uniref:NAD-dependent epimerase/dehydratase family protein n=1 Tax=Photobacterium chitinilyticum TaxID=2485123 RepID=A0A444JSE5_9GAMM|nr:NAD-dependent epimerase/dehydratase family protein [Photobacterium chitinilyticum]RWX55949.1 NAD-dependent epimerase/dehydratase family protein [Photobacterium chitinilyticum]
MKLIITGATGMVGKGALLEALDSPDVSEVLVVARRSCGVSHLKLHELIIDDFMQIAQVADQLTGYDATLFCLGVSSVGMSEHDYRVATYDLTLAFAHTVLEHNPEMTFCFVSGSGTDINSKTMWSRIKGETEAALQTLPFKGSYMFRPAFIQPLRGIRSKTAIYSAMYSALKIMNPLIMKLFPHYTTTTTQLGNAMIQTALHGFEREIIEAKDLTQF